MNAQWEEYWAARKMRERTDYAAIGQARAKALFAEAHEIGEKAAADVLNRHFNPDQEKPE